MAPRATSWQTRSYISIQQQKGENLLIQLLGARCRSTTFRRQLWLWIPAPVPTSWVTWNKHETLLGFRFLIWKNGGDDGNVIERWLTWYATQCDRGPPPASRSFLFNLNLHFFQCYTLQIGSTEVVHNLRSWFWVRWHFQLLYILSSQLLYLCYFTIVVKIIWEFK